MCVYCVCACVNERRELAGGMPGADFACDYYSRVSQRSSALSFIQTGFLDK